MVNRILIEIMDLYVNKTYTRKGFKLSKEVAISCNLEELRTIKEFIDTAYSELSKADASLYPHSHYKDFLNKGSEDINDIIISLKP